MKSKFAKYKDNLSSDDSFIYSYNTKVAKIDHKNKVVIKIKKSLLRPHDVNFLLGDASKAKRLLGWKPKGINSLVDDMVKYELSL